MDYVSSRVCINLLENDEKLFASQVKEFNNDFNLRLISAKLLRRDKRETKYLLKQKKVTKKLSDSRYIFLKPLEKTFIEILLTLAVEEPC